MNREFNTERMLIEKYIDRDLTVEEMQKAEHLIATSDDAQATYNDMKAAIAAVQYAATNQQVANIAQKYFSEEAEEKEVKGSVRIISFKRAGVYSLKVAAAILLVVTSYTVVAYSGVSADSMYADNFVSYDLPVTRGGNTQGDIEAAYRSKDWTTVVQAAAQQPVSQKNIFLAGMAALQLQQYQQAQRFFEQLTVLNKQSFPKLFADDNEYYMAITCIKLGQIEKATQLFQLIRGNSHHQYHSQAQEISLFKLKLLEYK